MSTPASAGLQRSDHEPGGCRVIVCDEICPALTEHDIRRWESPPHEHTRALALVRTLLELPEVPWDSGPEQRARPGGKPTVQLQHDAQ